MSSTVGQLFQRPGNYARLPSSVVAPGGGVGIFMGYPIAPILFVAAFDITLIHTRQMVDEVKLP